MARVIIDIPMNEIILAENDRSTYTDIDKVAVAVEDGDTPPVIVRRMLGAYELIAGYRRYHAHVLLGRDTIEAEIRDVDDHRAAKIMWDENHNRVNLNPIEEAQAVAKRMSLGMSEESVAEHVGHSVTWVKDRINLLTLIDQAQHLISVGQMRVGYGLAMVGLDKNRQNIALARLPHCKKTSEFVALCGRLLADQKQEQLFSWDDFMTKVQDQRDEDNQDVNKELIPNSAALPAVNSVSGTTADVLEQYIVDLLNSGNKEAAATVGHAYLALLEMHFISPPKLHTLKKRGTT